MHTIFCLQKRIFFTIFFPSPKSKRKDFGSLYRLLHDDSASIPFSLVKKFAIDVAKGMVYLHNSKPVILHRDLKSHNLLVDENYKVKISGKKSRPCDCVLFFFLSSCDTFDTSSFFLDFGLSKVLDPQNRTMTSCGTAAWAAPEILKNSRYTEKADVYR